MDAPSETPPTLSEREERMRHELGLGEAFTPEQSALIARVLESEAQRIEEEILKRMATRFSYLKARLSRKK